MRYLALFAFALFALTLQSTLLAFQSFRPDLALCLVLYVAITQNVRRGALLSFLLGYAKDLFLGAPPGLFAFCLTILYLAIRPMHDKIRLEGFGFVAVLAFFSALATGFLELFLRHLFQSSFALSGADLGGRVLQGVATAIAAPLVVWVVRRISGLSSGKGEESLLARGYK